MRTVGRKVRAFSLLETLVVLALVALLVGLSAPLWAARLGRASVQDALSTVQEAVSFAVARARQDGRGASVVIRGERLAVLTPAPPAQDEAAGPAAVPVREEVLWESELAGVRRVATLGGATPAAGVVPESLVARIGADGIVVSEALRVRAEAGGEIEVEIDPFSARVSFVAVEPPGPSTSPNESSGSSVRSVPDELGAVSPGLPGEGFPAGVNG